MAENKKQMMLGLAMFGVPGLSFKSWSDPKINFEKYPDLSYDIKAAQLAEKGKFQFMFFGDFPATKETDNANAQSMGVDPLLIATVIAHNTKHIGMAITKATSWNSVYEIARQFKSLDAISNGRAAWNAVTGANGVSASAYGVKLSPSFDRYGKAYEFTEAVQTLWGTWGEDALKLDKENKVFADYDEVESVSIKGKYVESTGTLPIPPSKQGQPVIFHSGGSGNSIAYAGKYANAMIGEVWTIEQGRETRNALRQTAVENGRDPDEIKFIAGVMPLIGDTKKDALERHSQFIDEQTFYQRVAQIGYALGVQFTMADIDKPIDPEILDNVVVTPYSDPRIENIIKVAREGWTLRYVIYHSVIDYHPAAVGTAEDIADYLTEWFEQGGADGFWVMPNVYEVDLPRFVDEVVPILQERGIFHEDYEGDTLRENFGIPYQYGLKKEEK
ncbi:LLM class flavin-dependent oxidoreductase [Staphylococcus muscae]|uniref:F420-dependent methylene-tetrahydromethanopterin reductase n=1 Tax=Staphylococcus muscae TaxID=1294 RepID=A0A240C5I4_9STAP|nr:NtaA/DmoA family FMN-dependent monooxygenase [Staphylococcus muscae]AVQ33404.1 LLM class flavin-dependent oxidoreductase [Staphylococcus muscae]PNZ03272.1 LLM class flavin-dependent oxidoreductase [Staphylococcus muscae]GGA89895.1 nitrilotriacetate monooxygenase [Staphylococcus muscae]SNW03185.1 F420-dependent methylene-tetrahydromethanopterin reductase [Staphylococcus muscae]